MSFVEEKDFQVSLADLKLQHPIMNAAGTCRSIEEVEELASSPVSAIMVGSITCESRNGNGGNVFWTSPDGQFSINANGLPNRGIDFYKRALPKMADIAHKANKLLFVSVAGFSPEQYGLLTQKAFQLGADIIELNLSCPNVWSEGIQKIISCFDEELLFATISEITDSVQEESRVGVKISPFSDYFLLENIAGLLGNWRLIKFVTVCNTFPNGFALDEKGKPVITFGDGYGGLSGPALKPIALGQVKWLRDLLPEWIDIIGCGGIATGKDVADFLVAGATAVQVGTAFLNGGVKVFDKILSEYVDIAIKAM